MLLNTTHCAFKKCKSNETFYACKCRKCILTCQEFPSVRLREGGEKWKRLELSSELNSGERRACQRDRGCTQQNAKGTAGCTQHAKSDTRHAVIVMALRMTAFVRLSNRPIVALTQNDSVHHPAPPHPCAQTLSDLCKWLTRSPKNKNNCHKKRKTLINHPLRHHQLVYFILCINTLLTTINATAVTHHDVRVSSVQKKKEKKKQHTTPVLTWQAWTHETYAVGKAACAVCKNATMSSLKVCLKL